MLMKKQKLQQVRQIVKRQDDSKPWGQDAHVKVSEIYSGFKWKSPGLPLQLLIIIIIIIFFYMLLLLLVPEGHIAAAHYHHHHNPFSICYYYLCLRAISC